MTRLQEMGATGIGNAEQHAGHRRVEILSVIILVVSVALVVFPF